MSTLEELEKKLEVAKVAMDNAMDALSRADWIANDAISTYDSVGDAYNAAVAALENYDPINNGDY